MDKNSHCPVVGSFIRCALLCRDAWTTRFKPDLIGPSDRWQLSQIHEQPQQWQEVFDTRVFVAALLCLRRLVESAPMVDEMVLSSLGWQEVLYEDLEPIWEKFLEPAYLAKGEWHVLGQPRIIGQSADIPAKMAIDLVTALQPVLTTAQMLLQESLPHKLSLGESLVRFFRQLGEPSSYYVEFATILAGIQPKTQDTWRSQRVRLYPAQGF